MVEQPKSPRLIDVPPIRDAPVSPIVSWPQIECIIEAPLRAAMHDFWEKGIKTVETSANQEDARIGRVFFDIEAYSLSEENQRIAIKLGAERKLKRDLEVYQFGYGVDGNTLTEAVVKWSRGIAAEFKNQNSKENF